MSIEKNVNIPAPLKSEQLAMHRLIFDAAHEENKRIGLPVSFADLSAITVAITKHLWEHGVKLPEAETPPQEPSKETEEPQEGKEAVRCPVCGDNRTRMQLDLHRNEFKHVCDGCGLHWKVENNLPTLKDSGSRREFDTGAVRDIAEGKGRCDLMPLDVIANILGNDNAPDFVLDSIRAYMETGNTKALFQAVEYFRNAWGVPTETMLLELAKHFEEGAKKYGEHNWQKGIPVHCYIDSAVRHYLKWRRGDKDEPHDRAFVWNLICCIWTVENKPELFDLPQKEHEPERERG